MNERFVLLGVARPRSDWFARVGRWTTAAALPAEFVRCLSVGDLRARLASSRPFSAVLADASMPGVDRELLATAADAGVPVIVVDGGTAVDWADLGASRVLPPWFDRETLLEALTSHARTVGAEPHGPRIDASTDPAAPGRATVIAVTGSGGTGASTVATALAQGLAAPAGPGILLADLCRRADLAMLHDSHALIPSVQELAEAHRNGQPSRDDTANATFEVASRGYRLLLGLRNSRQWAAIRPHAFRAALDSLSSCFDAIVADVDPDVEGEHETGSRDIEERHTMSRQTFERADAVLAVGAPGLKGIHSLARLVLDLSTLGVDVGRLVPVVNWAPRSPRSRAEVAAAISRLVHARLPVAAGRLPSPVFLPRRDIDQAFRDATPLPRPLPELLVGAVTGVLRSEPSVTPSPEVARPTAGSLAPRRILPGSLGLGPVQGTA